MHVSSVCGQHVCYAKMDHSKLISSTHTHAHKYTGSDDSVIRHVSQVEKVPGPRHEAVQVGGAATHPLRDTQLHTHTHA
jgi:hypothetical protein